jgi:hypothetical protein
LQTQLVLYLRCLRLHGLHVGSLRAPLILLRHGREAEAQAQALGRHLLAPAHAAEAKECGGVAVVVAVV